MRLLLIEDDEALAQTLKTALIQQNYIVDVASDGEEGWDYALAFTYDLILLDVSLPKLDGISLCRRLRQAGYNSPILLLTAKSSSEDKVIGLDAGADDYVVKPCTVPELFARIRALLRRQSDSGAPILEWGQLRLDPSSCEVSYEHQPIPLSPKEYSLLELFLRHPRRVLRRNAILEHLWSFEDPPGENTIRAHIKGLRRKLKTAGVPEVIETVYGIGYRLKTLPEPKIASQQETLAAVNQAWERFKEPIIQRLRDLNQALEAWQQDTLTEELRHQAERQAHKLVGSLGMFGFEKGSQLAREIETCFLTLNEQQSDSNQPAIEQCRSLLAQLYQELGLSATSTAQSQPPSTPGEVPQKSTTKYNQPQLLIIDNNQTIIQQLYSEAHKWQIDLNFVPTLPQARDALAQQTPDCILLNLAIADQLFTSLQLLQEITSKHPDLPVLVITTGNKFDERLQVARLGGRILSSPPVVPAQVLEAVHDALQRAQSGQERVLAVDDDPILLELLREYLLPWGIQLTTLEDPRQFWPTLESTAPNLLILDVEMPHFDGIELCQVVRNDNTWSAVPIIFLTARRDQETIHRIYQAGADDYVPKPVTEPELVTRVFNRLERTRLLRNLAETDQLTGVTNRRQSTKELSRYIRLSQSYHQPLCMAVLDLDHFRKVNEQYGHAVGDKVLKHLANMLKQSFRSADIIARWGSEEFIIAMYGMNKHDGVKRITELLQSFRAEVFPSRDREPLQVTFSAGIADYPADGKDLASLYHAANQALMQAKATGRNRVLAV